MTTQSNRIRFSRRHTRRSGALAIAFSALLSPAGKIMLGAAAAAALIGGAAIQLIKPVVDPVQSPHTPSHSSFRLAQAKPAGTAYTPTNPGDETMPIVLIENGATLHISGAPGTGVHAAMNEPLPHAGQPGGDSNGPGMPAPRAKVPIEGHQSPQPTLNSFPPGFSRPTGRSPTPSGSPQKTPRVQNVPGENGNTGPQNGTVPYSTPNGTSTDPAQPADSTPPQGNDDPRNEAGGPAAPQGEPQYESVPNEKLAPGTPETQRQSGAGDPFNPITPATAGPLSANDLSLPQTRSLNRAAIPEPSILGLMLIGFTALAWMSRPRFLPAPQA